MNKPINFRNGDIYEFKKTHPCGGKNWQLIRVGVDCKLACTTCKHIIIIPRVELPKKIKRIVFHEEIPG
ncbi:MAG TPA: DUF951 domain-containing protein [Bacilli bacterium]|nr:DUF951 domain-containing protein [Bacilli bacterium]HOH18728.1 DUF951 domain-containing protein [Bacilli bacterium]HPX84227.1 DUF951 domain-containing protein [Bacilli bacterium]HQC74142.1 DUF951 domain-containing protein [Bacilli bacterium]